MEEKAATFTIAEWDQIGNALAERPYKEVAGLLAKLINQLNSKPGLSVVPSTDGKGEVNG